MKKTGVIGVNPRQKIEPHLNPPTTGRLVLLDG
jgi:hypothetical protein